VYSHNVNGLRDEAKLEYIPRLMEKKKIDAYLIQETHLAGFFEKIIINDFYFIHHGLESQPAKGKRGGVAIILSPDMHRQWKQSGKAKKIFKGGSTIGNTTRILSINIRFELSPCSKKKSIENSNKKSLKIYASPQYIFLILDIKNAK
jgi:exonuclease III